MCFVLVDVGIDDCCVGGFDGLCLLYDFFLVVVVFY